MSGQPDLAASVVFLIGLFVVVQVVVCDDDAQNHAEGEVLPVPDCDAPLGGFDDDRLGGKLQQGVAAIIRAIYFFFGSTVEVKLERIIPTTSGMISSSGKAEKLSNHSIGSGMVGFAVLASVQIRL